MAGKRQHYLPRFLSKRFNSRNESKKFMSWVFTKDKVYEANILNIGLQQYFYGDGNINTNLDSKITDLENKFSKQIDEIRKLNFNTNIKNVEEISNLVYFQLIRTRNIRLTFADVYNSGINSASNRIEEDFLETDRIKRMFRNNEQYKKLRTLIPQKQLECMLDVHIKAIKESGIDSYFRELLKKTEVVSKNVHNSMIEGHINGENKGIYKNLLNLHWNLVHCQGSIDG